MTIISFKKLFELTANIPVGQTHSWHTSGPAKWQMPLRNG